MPHWRQRKFYLHMRHVRNEKREWNSQCEVKNTNVGVRMEGVNLLSLHKCIAHLTYKK